MTPIEKFIIAYEAGRARKVIKFNHRTQEGSPEWFFLVDCGRHLERVPCSTCGVKPEIKWSTDRLYPTVDAYESVKLGCPQCFKYVELHCPAEEFDGSRGVMANALTGWWCQWQQPEYHPSDFESAGGICVAKKVLDDHFSKVLAADAPAPEPTIPPPPETP